MHKAFVFAAALCPALALAQEPQVPLYAEDSAEAGLATPFLGGWQYMVGGGPAVFDCDGDGALDIFLPGGEGPSGLYRNLSAPGGPLRFAAVAGLEMTEVVGAYPIDIDSDGSVDLALLRVGEDRLLRGLGDCRFEPANALWGFDGADAWTTAFSATWEPGATWPTLAFGSYVDRREEAFPWGTCTDNLLYRPDPAGTGFAAPLPLTPAFCTLSMLFSDWDGTGRRDLRVSNDRQYYKGGQEQLWHVEPGAPPRLYTEAEGWQRLRIWGMGIASRDLDADGDTELFLTSMADNKLQVLKAPAEGAPVLPQYRDEAFKRGATAHRPHTGPDTRPSTAWHAEFGDVNNDGLADLFIVKGNVEKMPDFAQEDPNNLLLQRPDGTFAEGSVQAGVASMKTGRGGALADFNADGLLDILVTNRWEPPQIWRNQGTAGNWLTVGLHQLGANPHAVGAWVELRAPALQRQEVTIGGGHAGGQLGPLHFGLGAETTAEVRAIWPDGEVGDWLRVDAGTRVVLSRE